MGSTGTEEGLIYEVRMCDVCRTSARRLFCHPPKLPAAVTFAAGGAGERRLAEAAGEGRSAGPLAAAAAASAAAIYAALR